MCLLFGLHFGLSQTLACLSLAPLLPWRRRRRRRRRRRLALCRLIPGFPIPLQLVNPSI